MNKSLKINLLTFFALAIILLSFAKIYKTYEYNKTEGRFEAFLVMVIACSNGLLIRTLKGQSQQPQG